MPGTFVYTPLAGTVLNAGEGQTLSVTFIRTDTTDYASTTASVSVNVAAATPTVTWANPADIRFGVALGAAQLDATASVPGAFIYTPTTGTVLPIGANALSVEFIPTDAVDYVSITANCCDQCAQHSAGVHVCAESATPNPADANTTVTFTCAAGASDGDTVTIVWDLRMALPHWVRAFSMLSPQREIIR